ncbi:MAG: esterase-like activity of phytase family protein [Deltaproteobacteria bacterium]|nr:esterase-like activity of phytase family protein [Deltaproteobacteria bacterium]
MTRAWLLLLAACSSSSSRGKIDRERADELFAEVVVDTAPGLSGLAADETGALWTVAERAAKAYRITLDASDHPTVQGFDVTGIPDGTDLEGIAVLAPGKLALGTEGRENGVAKVLLAEQRGAAAFVVTRTIELPEDRIGIKLEHNHGAEGVCGFGDTIVVAIEGAGIDGGRRWAPVMRIERGAIVKRHRVWLTSKTGKLSGLDCKLERDGTVAAIAVERHFEETRILTFALRDAEDVTPAIALDLGPVLNNTLNLEGIAWLPDGRVVAVIDNQWKTIEGPSELLVFKRGALR